MKEYTVTFHLTEEQETAVKEIAGRLGTTEEGAFAHMMLTGSAHDINLKIEMVQRSINRGILPVKKEGD